MLKQFKAESQRLMELMINSIYTHKEIFLRELISNSSDALDKRYYKELSDENQTFDNSSFVIWVQPDAESRTLTISDTGIGMTSEEMEANLGTIARSGSFEFKKTADLKDGYDIIGQFGVGFYSSFMVADKVEVFSKVALGETWVWESAGSDGYTLTKAAPDQEIPTDSGTKVVLHLKENTEDSEEDYDQYFQDYRIQSLVKTYSDFIKYPIQMNTTHHHHEEEKEDGEHVEEHDHTVTEVLNSQVPIWRKNKNELTKEDYERFYMDKHFGFDKPLKYAHVSVEGTVSYTAILYIPSSVPFNFYTKEYAKGLELYSNGVLIMNKCADLLPDYFAFVQGLVDSADLSLNISRELLQHDRQLQVISKRVQERIKTELLSLLKDNREEYVKFFDAFGQQLKYGIYQDWGAHKEVLQDLLLFHSSNAETTTTLEEYVGRMKEDQKTIYYVSGESVAKVSKMPQVESLVEQGTEVLYLVDQVDEFALISMFSYNEKSFKNVSEVDDKEEEAESIDEDTKKLLADMKELLGTQVVDVKASSRLRAHPCCLSTQKGVSIEMEKTLKNMPGAQNVSAQKVLELNVNHEMMTRLKEAYSADKDKFAVYTRLLLGQALLIEGLSPEDPVAFSDDICRLF
jgi:molecular chaperone HtpG